ncbi:ABC transporter substrate-binding protein [Aquabacterium sp. OR-4]|uniref:ABC transporter substrate-binding protein n=1 Tax=Aquabacterium sp. OR-4 TaxID=2978127 RepID=UPI0021B37CCE|nr:ABC transporter substrate-binding protein [Aquabacterium sp. OR-4]MDT7837524.1 ABC transporter substrate-binding protein [Aquabacterium sp. OR-4]
MSSPQYPTPRFGLGAASRRQALHGLAGLGALATTPAFGQGERAIVLGQSAAVTGPAAQLGLQMHQGARLVFDAVNAAGGIGGRPIELRLVDDGYEPDRCKANTEKFIRDEVFALFGYVGTPTALAALPAVTQAQIPFIAPFTGAQALREPFNRNVFHVRASYFDETALIVRHLNGLRLHKIAVFRQNDSYGQAGLDGVQRALAALGRNPLAVGTVERNSVDVAAAVRTIVSTMPEAVVQISAYKSCAAFIRAARAAGYGGLFYNVSFVGTQALADELGKDARGVQISQVMPSPFSTTNGASREYLEAIAKAGDQHKPNYSGMEGFVAARVLVEGLRRAAAGNRRPSREALIDSLETLRLDFGGHTIGFAPRQHVGSHFVELTMLTEDGKVRR